MNLQERKKEIADLKEKIEELKEYLSCSDCRACYDVVLRLDQLKIIIKSLEDETVFLEKMD
jgi:hypothetical protein